MNFHPSGIFVPLITPFTDTDEVATADLERLAHEVIDEGASGIVALGTTGEPSSLTPDERREVLEICGQVSRERGVPLLVGAGTNDTAGTMRAIEEVHGLVDAVGVLAAVPYYTRPSEAGVVAHFEHVADRSPLPLVLYNVPYRTGQSLGWESIVRLSRHPRIVGIKQAVGTVDTDTAHLFAECADSFAILAGEDTLVSPMLAMGAPGAVLASANVCTRVFVELLHLWRSGIPVEARALANRLVAPAEALMSAPNPTVIKAVLHAQGRISTANARLPLLTVCESSTIADVFQQLPLRA
ncbi:4-hydroxy-tetrahydrodipicolinate synthase [Prescottella defluvii]